MKKVIHTALARAVAGRNIPDESIATVSARLNDLSIPIKGIDVCTHGICLDYFIDGNNWGEKLQKLATVPGSKLGTVTTFPFGIVNPDLVHVRIEHGFEELVGQIERRS